MFCKAIYGANRECRRRRHATGHSLALASSIHDRSNLASTTTPPLRSPFGIVSSRDFHDEGRYCEFPISCGNSRNPMLRPAAPTIKDWRTLPRIKNHMNAARGVSRRQSAISKFCQQLDSTL
ncbi:hypothetical protein KIN20_036129 [Parelaphostrongylus tenuis]|uniref:Uncharacterized protein n=1 Tax=Parelaphostrongylus tenuis TaxID=148309 RepID=A0AAD5RC46_PARTN|nr:hypothetical protein KIN20_036129 [Parelaphostrongylus tenuis]